MQNGANKFSTTVAALCMRWPLATSVNDHGGYGRLPSEIIRDPRRSQGHKFLLADRSRHAGTWGCNHRKMAATVRGGFSGSVFKRAVREATDACDLKRWQGRGKG